MKDKLTILIPTSPIPSHPSTAILDDCIGKIREYPELKDCKIILMMDGIHHSLMHREAQYRQYFETVRKELPNGKYGPLEIRWWDSHTHQAEMTRNILRQDGMYIAVDTPYILFCEHDTAPINEIPWEKIIEAMDANTDINYVRFHIFHAFLPEHDYLMLGEEKHSGIPLMRTIQWSQRPHIARADWYRDILNTYFHGKPTMIEDVMHGICQDKYNAEKKDVFGMFIYAPEGNKLRSYHSDGRAGDEKIIEG